MESKLAGRAVFVDRDGTLIEGEGAGVRDLASEDKVKLFPSAVAGVKRLNSIGLPVICITNQPQVARGLCTEEDVKRLNSFIGSEFAKHGARIDSWYYCPHHPTAGNGPYTKDCDCRKPKIGLLKQAAVDYKLDLTKCFFIGDWRRDVEAGRNAGCTTILVGSKEEAAVAKPDYYCNDFEDAAKFVEARL